MRYCTHTRFRQSNMYKRDDTYITVHTKFQLHSPTQGVKTTCTITTEEAAVSVCFFSQLLYSFCSLQKQADELNNSITEGSFQKTTVFVLLTWMCLYLVPMQRVQHFPLSEVQDLHCRVTGCSDKEITGWVESQAVHHTTVDWKTHTHVIRGTDIFSLLLKCIPKSKNTLSACN